MVRHTAFDNLVRHTAFGKQENVQLGKTQTLLYLAFPFLYFQGARGRRDSDKDQSPSLSVPPLSLPLVTSAERWAVWVDAPTESRGLELPAQLDGASRKLHTSML